MSQLMCGIAGFVGPHLTRNCADIAALMALQLRHRGPDGGGVWADLEAGVALAHRRLAVIDPTPAAAQPIRSSCGRCVLTFNGEIYNFRELRSELESAGRRFRGQSDSEVLVEACAEWGVEATLPRLLGMFAFAAWDTASRTLWLARDRIGVKPLFWGRFGDLLLFGSGLAALRAHPGWRPQMDHASLRAYLRWGHVPAPFSIYRGVRKLLPGEWLAVSPGDEPRSGRYWDAARVAAAGQAAPLAIDVEEAAERVEALLADAVWRRLVADVPVGAFLSGGIDSSFVVALAGEQAGRPLRTFTVRFPEPGYDESARARAVADHLGTRHAEVVVGPETAIRVFPHLPEWFDEPLLVRSQIPALAVSELARREVVVALSGDGGDELFGGYPGYFLVRALHRCVSAVPPRTRAGFADALGACASAVSVLAGLLPARVASELAGNQLARLIRALREDGSIEALYAQLYTSTSGALPLRDPGPEHPLLWQTAAHRGAITDPVARMGYYALLGTLVDRTLAKADRAGMAHGLEVRVPLLDHRLVELVWRLPPAVAHGGRWANKPLLRRLLYRRLPARLVDGPKKGFSCPLPEWLRGQLRAWAEERLHEPVLEREALLDGAAIRRLWEAHLAGAGNYWQLLWSVLVLVQWLVHWSRWRPAPAVAARSAELVSRPYPCASGSEAA